MEKHSRLGELTMIIVDVIVSDQMRLGRRGNDSSRGKG